MRTCVSAAIGFVGGLALMGVAVWLTMPRMMLVTHESRFDDVDRTAAALKAAIEEQNGWRCPAIRNMNASLEKEGQAMEQQISIVELCNAEYAREVLTDAPEVSTLMPCAWGIYKRNGKVLITGMNTGLMGKMFGGTIARVMGGSVTADETAILEKVTR
ncbi:MAG: DUF302 domain-containing protein [Kiritimatiellae bacterium]|nr:DUF302 domain-containing protein [Kiritimatiellia bacterium]